MDMISIGYSGASTAQVELNVTAQNTANAMTDGYTRRGDDQQHWRQLGFVKQRG